MKINIEDFEEVLFWSCPYKSCGNKNETWSALEDVVGDSVYCEGCERYIDVKKTKPLT